MDTYMQFSFDDEVSGDSDGMNAICSRLEAADNVISRQDVDHPALRLYICGQFLRNMKSAIYVMRRRR